MMLSQLQQVDYKAKGFNLTTETQKALLWKKIDLKRSRWIEAVRLSVSGIFRGELKRIKKAVKGSSPDAVPEISEGVIDRNKDEWEKFFQATYLSVGRVFAVDTVRAVKQKGVHGLITKFGFTYKEIIPKDPFSLIDPFILQHIRETSGDKIIGITEATKKQIKTEIETGIIEGEGVREISERIDGIYLENIITNRSKLIARTEVMQASNAGSIAGAKSTGIPNLRKVWLTTRDSRTRPNHEDIDGDKIGIDGVFILGDGSRLNFPGDSSLGAAAGQVINCRCTQFFEGE